MGLNNSKTNIIYKTIILKYKKIAYLYEFCEKIKYIEIIKPTNILIMYIFKLNYFNLILCEEKKCYSLEMIKNRININDKLKIINEIYNGIFNLHKLNIYHNNIKLSNVLLSKDISVYINDYCINEIRRINEMYIYDEFNDIYDIGIIIKELLRKEIDINEYKYKFKCNKTPNTILLINNNVKYKENLKIVEELIKLYNESYDYSFYLFTLLDYTWLNISDTLKIEYKTLKYKKKIESINNKEIMLDKIIISNIHDKCSLNLFEKYILYKGIEYICDNLMFVSSITHIDLSSNWICDNGLIILSNRLNYIIQLKELNLSCIHNILLVNGITDKSLKVFSNNLQYVRKMKMLNLSNNEISSNGLIEFSKNIKYINKIMLLDFGVNNINDYGIIYFNSKLKEISYLEYLKLNNNLISSNGLISLCNNINYITKLCVLDISNNRITNNGIEALEENLSKMKKIRYINLNDNLITNTYMYKNRIIQNNPTIYIYL